MNQNNPYQREGDPGCGIAASCVRRRTIDGLPPESFLLTLPLPADNQAMLGPKPTTYALPHTPWTQHLGNQAMHTTTDTGSCISLSGVHATSLPHPLAYGGWTRTNARPKDPKQGRNAQHEANARANDPTAGRMALVNLRYQCGFNTIDAIIPRSFTMLPQALLALDT